MTASLQREEMRAFSDGAALVGAVVCGAIGLVWAVAGKRHRHGDCRLDTGDRLGHGWGLSD